MNKALLFLLLPIVTFAEVSTNNQAQGLLNIFDTAQVAWIAAIIPVALRLFWLLVIIDWVWTFGMLVLKGTEFAELMTTLIQKLLIIGIFLALFQFTSWIDSIPRSFSILADNANALATPIEPDTILEQGFNIVNIVWGGTSWFSSPGDSIALVLAGIIILFAFIIMTAIFFVVIVKIYLLTVGAYIVLALGGLGYTRTIGINPLIAIFKAGLELFFIKLLLGFSLNTINTMAANVGTDNNSIMAMIGVSILIAALVSMVSGLVDSLANGYLGTNGSLGGNTKSAMIGAGAGAVGGTMAAMSQVQNSQALSTQQNQSSNSDSGSFKNTAAQKAKSASAMTIGGVAGGMSGAVKGALGFSPLNSGSKSGTTVGKLFSSNTSNDSSNNKSTSSSSSSSSGDLLSGTIGSETSSNTQNKQSNNNENQDDSSYISGVPNNDTNN
jgi:type IV secretion system protein TrbL